MPSAIYKEVGCLISAEAGDMAVINDNATSSETAAALIRQRDSFSEGIYYVADYSTLATRMEVGSLVEFLEVLDLAGMSSIPLMADPKQRQGALPLAINLETEVLGTLDANGDFHALPSTPAKGFTPPNPFHRPR